MSTATDLSRLVARRVELVLDHDAVVEGVVCSVGLAGLVVKTAAGVVDVPAASVDAVNVPTSAGFVSTS